MRLSVLGSGSRGNSVVIESGGRHLLVDAGFSAKNTGHRMASLGLTLDQFNSVILTHEHGDHCRGMDVLGRRYGLTAWGTAGTLQQANFSEEVTSASQGLFPGWPYEVEGFSVEAFTIPHDAAEPVGFVIEDSSGARVGIAGDMGCRSQLAWARLQQLDVLLLETNHDLDQLRTGPYPWSVKQRIASRHGHLSNHDAAEGLRDLLSDRLQKVVLYHLSESNNSPELAETAIAEVLHQEGSTAEILLTYQDKPTPWIEVSP